MDHLNFKISNLKKKKELFEITLEKNKNEKHL